MWRPHFSHMSKDNVFFAFFLDSPPPQDQKADIILKYDGDEARSLKSLGELPDSVQINAGADMMEGEEFGDDNFDFDEDAVDNLEAADITDL